MKPRGSHAVSKAHGERWWSFQRMLNLPAQAGEMRLAISPRQRRDIETLTSVKMKIGPFATAAKDMVLNVMDQERRRL